MQPQGDFKVSVTKDYLVFASAHFITFAGHECESLHGHNYRVGVVLEGGLDEESWFVFDFVVLKRLMKRLCDELDHKVLLPLENPKINIAQENGFVRVAYRGREKYRFPVEECALLPIPNTTVEMLARHLARKVRAEVTSLGVRHIDTVEIEVEETFGQSATYRETGA